MKTSLGLFETKFIPEPNSGYWLWTGGYDAKGYGKFKCKGRTLRAHRFSWTVYRGEIPPGTCVLHKCDVPCCVNPDHLFLGDNAANAADRVYKKRAASGPQNGRAKLTEADVRAIRQSSLSGILLGVRF